MLSFSDRVGVLFWSKFLIKLGQILEIEIESKEFFSDT